MKTVTVFLDITEFETKNLFARKLSAADFDLILPMYQNQLVMNTIGGVQSEDAIHKKFLWNLERWDKNGFGQWLWFDKASKNLVGRGGLRELEIEGELVVEVGYVLLPDFWNRGLATEMAMASIEIGFEILKLEELVCFTLATNKASQRVMEKAGFEFDRKFLYAEQPHVLYRLKSN